VPDPTATVAAAPPPFTDELQRFRAHLRGFIARELAPQAAGWERAQWFPNEVFATLAAEGYLGLKYPAQLGGGAVSGPDFQVEGVLADAVLAEELARCGSGGLAAGIGAHIGIATPPIWIFGTPEQQRRYLPAAIRGERIGALAITEPGAGSDVAGIRTRARRVNGGFVVNGSKLFITNGVRADFLVTAVTTGEGAGGHHGLSFLIIDRGPGVHSSPIEKLGWHASDTALIAFEDVFAPEENLLGQENEGFYLIMGNFQWERLLMALGAVGAMTWALERTLPVARELGRRRGGDAQALRHRVAEIAVGLQAARDLTYHALRLHAEGRDALREVTMAKLATQRRCHDVLDACLQIHYDAAGAASEAQVADLERGVRDARLGPIGGGTDEIMREILGRSLGL